MNFFYTHISSAAKESVNRILDTTFISAGKIAEQFEKELERNLKLKNVVTVNSGTSALHLGLDITGIQEGDEVIIPAQTFIATGLSVLMQKAVPVFADIQTETGNIDPESIKEKITSRTRVIIPVHWGGYPCDMDEINAIASNYNLKVIEDAAHALGASYKGKPIGTLSDFTAFSFQAIKQLTTGDGGALCCDKTEDYQAAKQKRWFGIDRENSKPSILGEREYDVSELGYKYHLNDYAAALGLANLNDLPEILNRHRIIANIYSKELSNIPGLSLLKYNSDRRSSYWIFTILVERREDFIRKLGSSGIPASVVHLRIDKNSVFGGVRKELINQEKFNELQVSLPVHSGLTEEDINTIINTIKKGW
jgi:perosamine synthetase